MKQPQKIVKKINLDTFESIIVQQSILDETYLASIIDYIKPEYFRDSNIKLIFEVICNFYTKRQKTPTATEIKVYLSNAEEKSAFKTVVTDFNLLDSKYNKEELYENTEQFLKERALHSALLKTINDSSSDVGAINTQSVLSTFEDACNISIIDDVGMDYMNDIDKFAERLQRVTKYIPTGYEWLDKILGGGWLEEGRAMYVFSGVTNSGKSIILGNAAVNLVKQNKNIILITMEMSEDIYGKRISSQLTDIPMKDLHTDIDLLVRNVKDIQEKNPSSKLHIKEFPPKSVTVNHIIGYIKKLTSVKKFKPDAIIVDYLNLIEAPVVTGNTYQDIKAVAEKLRAVSYMFNCPVITATQLGRNAFDKEDPGLEFTSESIGLSMTADFQASIWSSDEDKELGIIHMGVQKNRFGVNFGKHAFRINYDTLAITDMKEDFTSSSHVGEAESSISKLMSKLDEQ